MGIGDWGLGPIPNPQSPIPILYELIFKIFKRKKLINIILILFIFYNLLIKLFSKKQLKNN